MPFYMTLLWLLILNDVIWTSANSNVKKKPSLPSWPFQLWPKGIVRYKFEPKNSFNSSELAMIKTCMKSIEKNTCIRFIEKSNLSKGLVKIFQDKTSNVCGWADVGYRPNGKGRLSITCMAPFVFYHEMMHTLGFDHKDMHSNQTDYCGKYGLKRDEKLGKSVKAVDCAKLLNREKPSEAISQKFVKKINSLYCCKKKSGSRRNRDGELSFVSSNVEPEVKSLDESEPEMESSILYRSNVNAIDYNNNNPTVDRSKPEMERILGSIFSETQKGQSDLTGLLNQLGSKVTNLGQSGPMKQMKKPMKDVLGKMENLEQNLPMVDFVSGVDGHRKQHSTDHHTLEHKLMSLLNNNNNNISPVESEADNLINLLSSKMPLQHHQDGHRKYVSQDEAMREVLAQYVNRITNSKQNYAHHAFGSLNGSGGGQGQRKCEMIIKLLLEALREKRGQAGNQDYLLQSLAGLM